MYQLEARPATVRPDEQRLRDPGQPLRGRGPPDADERPGRQPPSSPRAGSPTRSPAWRTPDWCGARTASRTAAGCTRCSPSRAGRPCARSRPHHVASVRKHFIDLLPAEDLPALARVASPPSPNTSAGTRRPRRPAAAAERAGARPAGRPQPAAGSRSSNADPVRTASVPPCRTATSRAMASPSPAPPSSRLRASSSRTNRSKIRSRSASGTPAPVVARPAAPPTPPRAARTPAPLERRAAARCPADCRAPAPTAPATPPPPRPPAPRSAPTRSAIRCELSSRTSAAEIDPRVRRPLPRVQPGQQQQVRGQPLQPHGVLHRTRHVQQLRVRHRHFELGAQARDRAAQLVRGVGDEPALPLHGRLQRGQRLVRRPGQPADLVLRRPAPAPAGSDPSDAVIAAISPRIPSTGRSARRVTSQVTPATTTSSSGQPDQHGGRAPCARRSCSAASGAPAHTVSVPAAVSVSTDGGEPVVGPFPSVHRSPSRW